jgi:hypothetical protein
MSLPSSVVVHHRLLSPVGTACRGRLAQPSCEVAEQLRPVLVADAPSRPGPGPARLRHHVEVAQVAPTSSALAVLLVSGGMRPSMSDHLQLRHPVKVMSIDGCHLVPSSQRSHLAVMQLLSGGGPQVGQAARHADLFQGGCRHPDLRPTAGHRWPPAAVTLRATTQAGIGIPPYRGSLDPRLGPSDPRPILLSTGGAYWGRHGRPGHRGPVRRPPLLALLGGEAGVGKTRLIEQFAAAAEEQGVRVLGGGCVPLGEEGCRLRRSPRRYAASSATWTRPIWRWSPVPPGRSWAGYCPTWPGVARQLRPIPSLVAEDWSVKSRPRRRCHPATKSLHKGRAPAFLVMRSMSGSLRTTLRPPDHRRTSVHRCAAAWFEPDES